MSKTLKFKASKDNVFALACLAVSALLAYISFSYPLESSYFPRILAIFMGAMAMLLLIRKGFFAKDEKGSDASEYKSQLLSALIVFGAIAGYAFGISVFNYEITTVLFLFIFMTALGYRKLLLMAVTSLSITFILYWIFFEFLAVARPESLFFS